MPDNPPSPFWQQPAAQRTLRQSMQSGVLSRGLLFAGPDGVGKWAAALWVAKWLLCRERVGSEPCRRCRDCLRVENTSHPDLHLLFPIPSKSEEAAEEFLAAKAADPFAVVHYDRRPYITLDRIRALITELNKTSVEGAAKVVIIYSADQTRDDSCQSILLKTIEEPPPDTYFVLTSASPERFLPTILSRCQKVRFVAVDPERIAERLVSECSLEDTEARVVAELSGGGWGNAVRLASEEARAWHQVVMELWHGAFRVKPHQMLAQIDATIRPGGRRSVGFDALLRAFDVWSLCLLRDCLAVAGSGNRSESGTPITDLETGWACWRILQNGRGTLYVNVTDRHAVAGTFLALRRRLRCP